MAWSDWAGIATTGVLGAAGLYFANSVQRRTRADLDRAVAEKRFAAYGAMWAKLEVASPMSEVVADGDAEPIDRQALFDDLTRWYYENGNGMLLSRNTRNIYLAAKENLVCKPKDFRPAKDHDIVKGNDKARDGLIRRQLSLLRTSMRGDIAIYTTPWGSALTDDDIAFLGACGVDVTCPPWRAALPGQRTREEESRLRELEAHPPPWLEDSLGRFDRKAKPRAVETWRRLALAGDAVERRRNAERPPSA
jgi:hypothetical protein